MQRSPLELALVVALVASVPHLVRAQDPGRPSGIPSSAASSDSPEAALAAAENATAGASRRSDDGPTTPGNGGFDGRGDGVLELEGEREHAPRHAEKPSAALEERRDREKTALSQLSEPVLAGEANGLELRANGGAMRLDLAHAEGQVSLGLESSVEGQVSAIEVRQAVGPLALSADALTAKADADLGVEGLGASVGATLVEAGAELGPVDGSVGLGVGVSEELSLRDVDVKVGFGLQASISVDPLGAATDAWHAVGGLWHHHHRRRPRPAPAPRASSDGPAAPSARAERGIAECLPLLGS